MAKVSKISDSPLLSEKSSPSEKLNQDIIQELQQDGRVSFKDIASKLNTSEGTVRNRVNRMKEAGILKIVAMVDPTEFKYTTNAMIGINVSNTSNARKVAKRLSDHAEVVYIVWVAGRYDLLIEVVCDSDALFQQFLENHCFSNSDIDQFEVMSTIDMFKNQFLLKRQAF